MQAAENLPPPTLIAAASRLELAARSGKLTRRGIFIVLSFFALMAAGFGFLLWLLVRFGG